MTQALQLPDFSPQEADAVRAFVTVTLRLGVGTETVQDGVLTFKERQLLAWYQEQPRPFKMLLTNALFKLHAVGTAQAYPVRPAMGHKTPLTDLERAILTFSDEYTHKHGYPPSYRELGGAFSLSTHAVKRYLENLKVKGYLTFEPDKPRTLQILKQAEAS